MNVNVTAPAGPPLTANLAAWIAGPSDDALPDKSREHLKLCILDTLGCGLYGSLQPWGRIAAAVAEESAQGGSQVWGSSGRVGVAAAATVNGTAVHGFELDDVHLSGQLHPGAVTLPAAWALAELTEASGASLLNAIAAGYEIGIRLGIAAGRGHGLSGFHPTGTLGAVASAAAAAKLLGLDRMQAQAAIALGATQAAGLYSARTGGMSKRFHAGHAAGAGVTAGLLARRGFTASETAIEADFGGLFSAMRFDGDRDAVMRNLGTVWLLDGVGFKIFSTCASAQTVVEGAIELRNLGVTPENLDRLEVNMGSIAVSNVGWAYQPKDVVAAQMNGSYAAAVALMDGDAFVTQFTEERLADPDTVTLASRVKFQLDPEIEKGGLGLRHASRLVAHLRDGSAATVYNAQRPGGPGKEIPADRIIAKFERLAEPVIGSKAASRILDMVMDLENLTGIRGISAELGGAR